MAAPGSAELSERPAAAKPTASSPSRATHISRRDRSGVASQPCRIPRALTSSAGYTSALSRATVGASSKVAGRITAARR